MSLGGFSKRSHSDGADVTFCGRMFHRLETAATGKARSPTVELKAG